ncbi:DUF6252 family protein [Ekhidna sp.]|uniref:DUF6252 family protein n=1 Tax=Ekhidna sp. TaxID=2608089 RepID=UPI003B5CE32B
MKTSNLFALLISVFILASCGGDDDSGPAGNSISATVTGDISASFSASGEVQGQKLVVATLSNTSNGTVLSIVGTDVNGSSMNIAIPDFTGKGTYSLAITTANTATFTQIDTETFQPTGVTATSGSIEISESGTTINGTFDFTGEGNNDITADVTGKFSVIADEQ